MGKLGAWYKGKRRYCDVCGFDFGEREGKLFKQRGLWVCAACFDKVTDEQRQKSIKS